MPESPTASRVVPDLDRRSFMRHFASLGLAGTAFPAALWAVAQEQGRITKATIQCAEGIAGLEFSDAERELMLEGVNSNLEAFGRLRSVSIPNAVPPALQFEPLLPGTQPHLIRRPSRRSRPASVRPPDLEDLAFRSIPELAALLRTRQVTSEELTRMYLGRLRRHDAALEAFITLTEDLALVQARRADAEIAAGHYRGPLHGIPWGAKDLLAEDQYPTTWGAMPYEDQVIPYDATVVRRLEEAGAVLIAKLTLGALAWGDVWFGGRTRNPWNTEQGSSGSSAGSASATVAGLVGFSIGSETLGSIVSPATRCGATGLRPTFGRVSRHGAMALSWSMDKLGPICRSVEDCALVFEAIHGADGKDPTARSLPFAWDSTLGVGELRVGYYRSAFESERATDFDRAGLAVMRDLGVPLVPIEMPDEFPVDAIRFILNVEAAAAFDELTRSNRDDLLVRQIERAWPNVFRQSRLIPAVEYLQANRMRTMLMGAVEAAMDGIDVFITPSYGGDVLLTTNLTGHPAVTVPNGFREDGTPVSISFVGRLFGEAELLAAAKAFQDATGFHLERPPAFLPAATPPA
jgi:Asp-tRNA(Asn)/Glu-tRNA(Gln) amidotransferase A subunit family amidase